MNESERKRLEDDVRQYFANHPYGTLKQQLILDKIRFAENEPLDKVPGVTAYLYAVPRCGEEIIDCDNDVEWEQELAEIGTKYSVSIRLPYWCYAEF